MGLYDQEGSGDVVSIFSLAEQGDNTSSSLKGVTDIKWSHCRTYLYVSERKDTKITVWDVRKLYAKVTTLTGRDALTVQRLGIDVFLGEGNQEVAVGGGTNGKINLWDAHATSDPVASWEAHRGNLCPQRGYVKTTNIVTRSGNICSSQSRLVRLGCLMFWAAKSF